MSFYLHDTYTLLIISSILIVSFSLFHDKERLLLLLQYPLNQKYNLLYHRKDSILFILFSSINLLIVFSVSISFYLLHIKTALSFSIFLKIAATLLSFFILKSLTIYFLNWLFDLNDYAKKYYYGYTTSLMFCGIFFLPIIVFSSYFNHGVLIREFSSYLYYFFFIIYFSKKIILLNRLNLFRMGSMFYNILYLCALEIVPYLFLFKLLALIN